MWHQKFALARNVKFEPENPKDNQVYPIIVREISFYTTNPIIIKVQRAV